MFRDADNRERLAVEKILGPQNGKILEIGCGDGRLTKTLSGFVSTLYALDPDPFTIRDARDLLGNRVRFIIGSGEELPFTRGRLDTIVFSYSLHHQNPSSALSEARRVLRARGRVLVLEPEAESPVNMLFKLVYNEDGAYTRAAAAVRSCGLDLADNGSFPSIWRFVNFDEMVNYIYSHYDREPDQGGIIEMKNILDYKPGKSPVDIEDSTRWWLLSLR